MIGGDDCCIDGRHRSDVKSITDVVPSVWPDRVIEQYTDTDGDWLFYYKGLQTKQLIVMA